MFNMRPSFVLFQLWLLWLLSRTLHGSNLDALINSMDVNEQDNKDGNVLDMPICMVILTGKKGSLLVMRILEPGC